jgi:uncharacterized protein
MRLPLHISNNERYKMPFCADQGSRCFRISMRFLVRHGGEDRHPFPVPLQVYDEAIRVLKSAVRNAKLGRDEELGAIKRLDEQARLLERCVSGPPIEELIAQERAQSHQYGGRSVFGWAPTPVSSHRAELDRERAAEA